jgi:NifB/MoaA-like Fe-S oxidoreductase
VEAWQQTYLELLGRRLAFPADEYYLLAGRPFPPAEAYEGFPLHEDGVGMARAFEQELLGERTDPVGVQAGFFAWVDGAPAAGYRAPRAPQAGRGAGLRPPAPDGRPVVVLTGEYGAAVLAPLIARLDAPVAVHVRAVPNRFFGGNIAVTGLLVGADLAAVLADGPEGHRYLLPDVCLSGGRFLDGTTLADLPRPVEVVPTHGAALRQALGVG